MNTQEAILTRKSVRGFTKKQLTEEELKATIETNFVRSNTTPQAADI